MKSNRVSVRNERDIVFMPALAPLEASVIPAKEKRHFGALRQAKQAFRFGDEPVARGGQRLSGRRSASNR